MKWYLNKLGYLIAANGMFQHRVVWEACKGPIPKGHELHHKNGIRTDNRIENLECVTRKQHVDRHRQIGVVRECPECHRSFTALHQQRYCSRKCLIRPHNRKLVETRKAKRRAA